MNCERLEFDVASSTFLGPDGGGSASKNISNFETKTNIVQNPLAYFRSKMVAALVILEQMIAEQTIAAMDQIGGIREHTSHS